MRNVPVSDTSTTEMVTISRTEYEEYLELKKQNEWLLEQLCVIRNKQFGSSSEKASEGVYEQMSLLFDKAEVYVSEAEEPSAVEVRSHAKKQKSGQVRDILPEDIEVVETEHTLPEEDRQCRQCGEVMRAIGTEVRETLKFIPAKAVLQHDIYNTYSRDNCKRNDICTPVVQTPKDPALIPGGYASPEAVAHIAVQKLVMSSPLYQQGQEWNRQGIMVSRQTMSNWLLRYADDWLKPVYSELRRELVRHNYFHADETELQVLHGDGKSPRSRSYIWLYRTNGDAEVPIVLYDYRPGRGQEYPRAFLEGFHGYLQTDGYSGYRGL